MYRIGELAKRSQMSVDTLRYYEKEGLLQPTARSDSGYRLYADSVTARVDFIRRAKRVGFTLSEIQDLLELQIDKSAHSCEDVKSLTESKLIDIEARMRELEEIRRALSHLHESCCGGAESAEYCTILEALESADELLGDTPHAEATS